MLAVLQHYSTVAGTMPARVITTLFPLRPTEPTAVDRINQRGDIVFTQGGAKNSGTSGQYSFDDAQVGKLTIGLSATVTATTSTTAQLVNFNFTGARPTVLFAQLPAFLAGIPRRFDIESISISDTKVELLLRNENVKKLLLLEATHKPASPQIALAALQEFAGIQTDVLPFADAMMILTQSSIKVCHCKGDDCAPGDMPLPLKYCVGYYATKPSSCVIKSDDEYEKYDKGWRTNPQAYPLGEFRVHGSCNNDSDNAASTAKDGALKDVCKE